MCGRFVVTKNLSEALPDLLANLADWDPEFVNYNVAPGTDIPIVTDDLDESSGELQRHVSLAHWGFVPAWKKSFIERPQPINARVETVATNGMFRSAFRRGRCIVPASGYYEWHVDEHGKKQPYFITSAQRGLALAGIYEDWQDPAQPEIRHRSVAVLTRPTTGPAAFVHDRLPIMLDRDHYDAWLGDSLASAEQAELLLATSSSQVAQSLELWPVSAAVGNVRNNFEDLITPLVA